MRDPFHVEIMKQSGFYALHKSGKEIPIDLRLNPLETNDGVKFIAVLRDMTSQEQLQQQLQQAQKMEAIGHLTGGIAHDFNNMLASILGFTQLAMEIGDEHKDEKLNEYLGEVNLAGERARDLISQMLSFSRRNSEKQYVKLKLSILVKEVVSLIRPMLPSSIDINYDEGKDVPSINADPVKMHQVLMNLCINARDAVAGHGKIEVLLDKLTVNDEICSSCHSNFSGDYVVLTVADDGEGIDEQHLDKVFDPFYTTKEVGKGTGMGLSVVHGIMHDHRGHIIVKTAKGKGTTFTLLFP